MARILVHPPATHKLRTLTLGANAESKISLIFLVVYFETRRRCVSRCTVQVEFC